MNKHYLHLPAGVKDFLFEEAKKRRQVESTLTTLLAHYGFQEIIPPTFEYVHSFALASRMNGESEELPEHLYRFLDRDGRLLALRSDFTAQMARIAATRLAELPRPIKIFYSGKVFRVEPLHAGRSREKWQVGFEIMGQADLQADLNTLMIVLDCLYALPITSFRVAVGHIGYFNGLIQEAGIKNCEQIMHLKYLIERKDVETLQHYCQELGVPQHVNEAFVQLTRWHGSEDILEEAKEFAFRESSSKALQDIEQLWQQISKHPRFDHVFLDLSEVEGMGYYTGIMLKLYCAGKGQEVGSGGRYDRLVARFGCDMPAVGFSFDVDLLVQSLNL